MNDTQSTERTGNPITTARRVHRLRLRLRPRSGRLAVHSAVASLAAVAVVAGFTPTPAEASSWYYGSQVTAYGKSSMLSHWLTVTPQVSPMSGWSSQRVYYAVRSTDVTAGTTNTFGWYGPYVASTSTIPPTNCNELMQTGCVSITYPYSTLPSLPMWGYSRHGYQISVRVAYLTGNGWYKGPWTLLDSCQTTTSSYGGVSVGNLCWT